MILLLAVSVNAGYARGNIYFQSGNALMALPIITIIFPQNITYVQPDINIALDTEADQAINTWWYSLDAGVSNVTYNPVVSMLANKSANHVIVWANDSSNQIASAERYFSIMLGSASQTTNNLFIQGAIFKDNFLYTIALAALVIGIMAIGIAVYKKSDNEEYEVERID